MRKSTSTKDLLLVEQVKKYEFIYNNAHHDHGKRTPTLETWSTIASAIGDITVQQCKSRWQILRRRYESEYLKMTLKEDEDNKSDWEYMGSMSFLQRYVRHDENFLESLSKMSRRDKFCRACMSTVKVKDSKSCKSYNIFGTENFAEMFRQCTSLKTVPWDEYPHSVCEKCYEKVMDFCQFQDMCRNSLEKFNTMVEMGTKIYDITGVGQTELNSDLLQQLSTSTEFEITENHTEIVCESDVKEEIYADDPDPLAESANENVGVKESNDENTMLVQEDSIESEICSKVTKRKSTRQRKPLRSKTRRTEKHQLYREDLEKIESDELADNDSAKFGEPSDDEMSFSVDPEPSIGKEKTRKKASLKCDICQKIFRFSHRLEAHQRNHKGLPGYPCTYENCGRAFNRLDELRNHLNDHNDIPNDYKCSFDDCNRVYKCFSGLNKHKRTFHKCGKQLKTYTCETCGKVLTNPRSLTGHRFIHLDKSQWPYVCDEKDCTRRFRLMSQLKIHKNRHAGIKNYICPYCGVRKTTCTELKIHINFHTFEQKFPCEFCSKIFKSVGMKRTHINRVHEGKKPTNDTIFACSFCDRKFGSLQSKKYHEMTHTGEKPFTCEECGKTFTYPSGLKSHKNTHAKENPYACDQCDRRFKWPSALKTHMKLHSEGAKPYACEECGKRFRWPGSYYKHKKTHLDHKEENAFDGGEQEEEGKEKDINEENTMEPSRTEYEITYLVSNM